MRILVAAIHYPIASGLYIARALRRMGHDVRTVGPATGNQVWGMEVAAKYIWRPSYRLAHDRLSSATLEDMDGWQPELVICADCAYAIPKASSIPHVVYGVDNHVSAYDLGVKFDHYFLAHHDGPSLPVDDSRSNTTWLPCAHDPEWFTPSPIPWADREYDVCMVGVAYPRRVEIIRAMQTAGLKVFTALGLIGEDYAKAYQNSRISLCVSVRGDVAQRIFETAAMGCAILTDVCRDFERLGLQKHRDYEPVIDARQAVHTALRLTGHPQVAQDQTRRLLHWVKVHSWDARCQVILDTMSAGPHRRRPAQARTPQARTEVDPTGQAQTGHRDLETRPGVGRGGVL